jgi:hypothetical protein
MVIPLVHLGGTSQQQLLDEVCAAEGALRLAIEALKKAQPNGRDFPKFSESAPGIAQAIEEHCWRLTRLEQVAQELFDLADGIANQA